MFASIGIYKPCGIFTAGHFMLAGITLICILIALKYTRKIQKKNVYLIIRYTTVIMWLLEVIKIILNVKQNSIHDVNTYVPLYYCSMLLYAGLLSSFGNGKIKKIGDVALATGVAIGGIVFIIYPSTSLPMYPAFHFLSIHSFLFHGIMIYLGILVNITNYIKIKKEDIKCFAVLVGIMSIIALIINNLFDGNLMFISNNFPGTPIEIIYNLTNGDILYSIIMILAQITIPFYISYYIINSVDKIIHVRGKYEK